MSRRPIWSVAVVAYSVVVVSRLVGQVVQQGGPMGRLSIADPRAAAVTEYELALDAYQAWSFTQGFVHAQRALSLDSSFGLARALVARFRGGSTAR